MSAASDCKFVCTSTKQLWPSGCIVLVDFYPLKPHVVKGSPSGICSRFSVVVEKAFSANSYIGYESFRHNRDAGVHAVDKRQKGYQGKTAFIGV